MSRDTGYGFTIADMAMERRLDKVKTLNRSFLFKVSQLIDFRRISKVLEKSYRPGKRLNGSPSYPSIKMFKIMLLQGWYNLSDYAVEEALYVRLDFMKFCGFSIEDELPDHSTICRFRDKLLKLNLYDKLLSEINTQLQEQNILVKNGAIVDATIIESQCRPRKKVIEETVVQDRAEDLKSDETVSNYEINYSKDNQAKWLKKGKKFYYGYKSHTSVDSREGFILSCKITGANVSDTSEFERLVDSSLLSEGNVVLADKGYDSSSNREYLSSRNYIDGIMHKKKKGKKMEEYEKSINKFISKIRYKVERTFGTLKRDYHLRRSRYIGIKKVECEFLQKAMCFNIKKAILLCRN